MLSKESQKGVALDSKLNWREHVNYIKSIISKSIGIIRKYRKVLKKSTLLTLYYSFIFPYFIYCIEVWDNASDIYICLSQIIKLQKRVILGVFLIIRHILNRFINS